MTSLPKVTFGPEIWGLQNDGGISRYFKELVTGLSEIGAGGILLTQENENSRLAKIGFIAIHVRGGDYRKKGTPYLELNGDYYKVALGLLSELDPKLPKLVFTDDVPIAKEVLSGVTNLDFVNDNLLSAAESLKLMSKASGIVTANSTFSYWAAMISSNQSLVVSPKRWMKNKYHDEDFLPRTWKTI